MPFQSLSYRVGEAVRDALLRHEQARLGAAPHLLLSPDEIDEVRSGVQADLDGTTEIAFFPARYAEIKARIIGSDEMERQRLSVAALEVLSRWLEVETDLRCESLRQSHVQEPALWMEILPFALFPFPPSVHSAANLMAAESLLEEHLGESQYRVELDERILTSQAAQRALQNIWTGEYTFLDEVINCKRCYRVLADDLHEAERTLALYTRGNAEWTQCPHCSRPTFVRTLH